MEAKKTLLAAALVPLMSTLLVSCAQKFDYQVLSSSEIRGTRLNVVRRTEVDDKGQPDSHREPEVGIIDPSNTFHHCASSDCTEEEIQVAAESFAASSEESGGGGGDSGGGGGM